MKKGIGKMMLPLMGMLIGTLIAWFILDSILLGSVYGILVLLAIMFLQKLQAKKAVFYHNIESSYNFVNLMNIQMLSTSSTYEAYEGITTYLDIDFSNINSSDLVNQLNVIAEEYNINAFKMYVSTLQIYDTDGGNYRTMQQIPTALMQKTKVYYDELSKKKFYKLVEISSLFLLWIAVIAFLKFSIPEYYANMMANMTYQFVMLGILVGGSALYYFAFREFLKNKIRGM